MKNLLESSFISHYKLAASATVDIELKTDIAFELKDITPVGEGIAKYSNPNRKEMNVINYERFVDSLPTTFNKGRERCDFIMYSSDSSHFILNELTDTLPKYIPDFMRSDGTPKKGKRNKAIAQLKQTLRDVSVVPDIDTFIKRHNVKHCCFFNTQAHAPDGINATLAFNRLSFLVPNGYKMSSLDIESFGFELWEFSGNQTYLLEDQSTSSATE